MRIWCLGNVLMGDDAVGCRVAELLFEKKLNGVSHRFDDFECVDCGTTPENYIAQLRRDPPSSLLIVDAADMGLPPGELRRLLIEELDAAADVSHGVPLALLLSPFAGAFKITVLGIQPEAVQIGTALSESAERAARLAADLIGRNELDKVKRL